MGLVKATRSDNRCSGRSIKWRTRLLLESPPKAPGDLDTMWAICTTPENRHGWDPDEFFHNREEIIATELAWIESLGVELRHGRVLDFGYGLGRLTQPLADRFDEAVGVDVAASMIDGARIPGGSALCRPAQSGGTQPFQRVWHSPRRATCKCSVRRDGQMSIS